MGILRQKGIKNLKETGNCKNQRFKKFIYDDWTYEVSWLKITYYVAHMDLEIKKMNVFNVKEDYDNY